MNSFKISIRKWVACVVATSLYLSSFSTVSAITVHPAVLKNFVGPFRVPHSGPILRSGVPFNWEENSANVLDEDREIAGEYFSEPRQAALKSREEELEVNRAVRACKGRANCRRNLDSTLNLLMRMMETGR